MMVIMNKHRSPYFDPNRQRLAGSMRQSTKAAGWQPGSNSPSLPKLDVIPPAADDTIRAMTASPTRVRIQTEDFDLSLEAAALRAGDGRTGAVVSFLGTVRDVAGDAPAIEAMELEHYPGMTEASIEVMIDAAMQRFDIHGARVIHRVGRLAALDQIVLVLVTSRHRGQAFQACEFLMDYLKTQAPFWKKEYTAEGGQWVDAREADDAALARWGLSVAGNAGPSA